MFDLNESSFRLLKNDPFFAAVSRCVSKIENRAIPTAGVCLNENTGWFELHFNPDFFDKLGVTDEKGQPVTDKIKILDRREVEIAGVLKHEFYHLIFEHVTDRLPAEGMNRLWNIAADLAINGELENELPWTACVPGREYTDPKTGTVNRDFVDLPKGLSAEQYYALLKEKVKKKQEEKKNGKGQPQNGEGEGEGEPGSGMQGPLDDHSMWGGEGQENQADSIAKEIAKERMKDALKEAANEALTGGRGWGNISAQMQKEILRRLTSVVDWKAVLRYFVKTSQKASRMNSMKKINRRYPYIHSGRKTSRTANIAISIDQSGSVSDSMLEVFFAELNKLSEIASFTVIPFDDKVFEEKIYVWKKGEKRRWDRVLCGGTNFDAPTEYVNEHQYDGHIVLTDLCAPKPKNSKVQRLWLTTEDCAKNPYFATQERILAIPNKHLNPQG